MASSSRLGDAGGGLPEDKDVEGTGRGEEREESVVLET